MQDDLVTTTADWAQWDSTYAFATGASKTYTNDNLGLATLRRLRLSFLIITDQRGQVIYSRARTADGEQLTEAPADIVTMARSGGRLSGIANPRAPVSGLAAAGPDVYLVSSQPVLNSRGDALPLGRMIMGRSLPAIVAPSVTRATGLPIDVQAVSTNNAEVIYESLGRDTLRPHGGRLHAYTPLDDIWGQPVAQLHIELARPVQAMLREARHYLLISTLIVGLLICVAALLFIKSKVVAPLEKLARVVGDIGAAGFNGQRVPQVSGTREFETLAASINAMLQQLEQQHALRRDRDAAIESNRLKSEFLATMSHEIRTPMNGVLGMTELLQRTELNARQRHLSDTVLRSARSLLDILNDILDFSKIESGKEQLEATMFSPRELISTLTAPFVATAQGKGLVFTMNVHGNVPAYLIGDAVRLRQILNNLIGNAIKFTDTGSVNVECTRGHADADRTQLLFSVSDTGIGISRDVQERIFEPFAQAASNTSRRYGGTGLGLAIVRRLVTLMSGQITLESDTGRGSRFSFSIVLQNALDTSPCLTAPEMATGPRFSMANAPAVLLAEDNAVNREVLTEMLEHIGCRVTVVENGAEAVAAAAGHNFDAILMDCQMPVMDGQAAAAEIRALERVTLRRSVIVALTADATPENEQRCLDSGMDAVVTKPVSQARLHDLILRAVRAFGARSNAQQELISV